MDQQPSIVEINIIHGRSLPPVLRTAALDLTLHLLPMCLTFTVHIKNQIVNQFKSRYCTIRSTVLGYESLNVGRSAETLSAEHIFSCEDPLWNFFGYLYTSCPFVNYLGRSILLHFKILQNWPGYITVNFKPGHGLQKLDWCLVFGSHLTICVFLLGNLDSATAEVETDVMECCTIKQTPKNRPNKNCGHRNLDDRKEVRLEHFSLGYCFLCTGHGTQLYGRIFYYVIPKREVQTQVCHFSENYSSA